jgi:hypothetical protein
MPGEVDGSSDAGVALPHAANSKANVRRIGYFMGDSFTPALSEKEP